MQFLAENCPVRLGFFYHSCIMLGLSGYDSTAHDKHIQVVQASRLGLDLYILSFLFFRSWVRMSKHAVSIYARARLRQSLFFSSMPEAFCYQAKHGRKSDRGVG